MPLTINEKQAGAGGNATKDGAGDDTTSRKVAGLTNNEMTLDCGFALKETHRYSAGQTIFKQGEACDTIMFVLNGTVAIHQTTGTDVTSLLGLREPGQVLGYGGLLDPSRNTTTATALSDCRICCIETCRFGELLDTHPALSRTIINHMGLELNAAYEARIRAVHFRVLARLALLLLDLKDHHATVDNTGNIVITIPMSRRDMASAIGTRPESLSRAIRELEMNGIAKFSKKQVIIEDLDDLLDASENQKAADKTAE